MGHISNSNAGEDMAVNRLVGGRSGVLVNKSMGGLLWRKRQSGNSALCGGFVPSLSIVSSL